VGGFDTGTIRAIVVDDPAGAFYRISWDHDTTHEIMVVEAVLVRATQQLGGLPGASASL
jgi:hypothetical protein